MEENTHCVICDEATEGTLLCPHCAEADQRVHQMPGNALCGLCGQRSPKFTTRELQEYITWCYPCAIAVTRFIFARRFLMRERGK